MTHRRMQTTPFRVKGLKSSRFWYIMKEKHKGTVKSQMDSVIYIHGKGGNADEAEFLKPLFNEFCVVGFDYKSQTPWEAKDEFPTFFDGVCKKIDHVILVANSVLLCVWG